MTKDITACKFSVGPWDFFCSDATSRTLDSTHGVRNRDRDVPKRDKLKEPCSFWRIVTWTYFATASTAGAGVGARFYLSNDMRRFTLGVKKDARVNERLDWLDSVK